MASKEVAKRWQPPRCRCDYRNFTLFKRCNKYIDETTPWVLGKDESKKGSPVLQYFGI